MRLKLLFEGNYKILGVMDGEDCEVDDFLSGGQADLKGTREGLVEMLIHVAEVGLHKVPGGWFKEVDKKRKIFEFKKGDLRLFFFKGENGHIAVCTSGVLKQGQKVDKGAVNHAAKCKTSYDQALVNQTIEVVDEAE